MGGYSKGEGSIATEDGKVTPLGDYDLMVITRSPHLKPIRTQYDDLARRFGIDHIDISSYWIGLLPHVGKRIFWYELKFGSRVLFGNKEALQSIPILGPEEIELNEGISLMFNRLDGLLRYFDPGSRSGAPTRQAERMLIFEAVKGILACGDSFLILRRKYHYSYRMRLNALKTIASKDFPAFMRGNPRFMSDFEAATRFKLQPGFSKVRDPVGLWRTALQYLLRTIPYYWQAWIGPRDCGSPDFPARLLSRSRFRPADYLAYNLFSGARVRSFRTLLRFDRSFSDVVRASLFLLAQSINDDIASAEVDRAIGLVSSIMPLGKASVRSLSPREKWLFARDLIDLAWASSRR